MVHKKRQVKHESVQVYTERLYGLANDAFTKADRVAVELKLVEVVIDGVYHGNIYTIPYHGILPSHGNTISHSGHNICHTIIATHIKWQ